MKSEDIFKRTYFKSLGLICEEEETAKETTETPEAEFKQVTFLTSDPALIDTLNNTFEEVVFFVTNEDGEVEEVKFKKDSFGNIEISEVNEVTEEQVEDANITDTVEEPTEYEEDEETEMVEEI
jgi:hypothetical protein